MGDLSWNPSTWTPSNLAEELVEGLTGSEGLGDVAGLWAAGATGDVKGVADQSYDLGDNVGKGLGKFVEGVWNAAKDAIEVFSNPGQVKPPSQNPGQVDGYAPPAGPDAGQVPPTDIGNMDTDSALGAEEGGKSVSDQIKDPNEDFSFLDSDKYSLEDKIFMLLMKLQKSQNEKIGNEMKGLKAKKAEGKAIESFDMTELNRATNELSQLTTLSTNLMKLFKDMKDATIQNIGR